jgi:ribosome production factor 2
MSFQSSLFSTHPTFQLLKSMLLDFYNGHEITEIPLQGLETVMTITAGPMDGDQTGASSAAMAMEGANSSMESKERLPLVHIRVYTIKMLASGTKVPKISLTEMGPRMDLSMRRTQMPDPEMWKEAVKRPKMDKKQITSGQGKKRKNIETDEMGDLVGRVHVAKQDLNKMKGKRMRVLNATPAERAAKKQKNEDITMD